MDFAVKKRLIFHFYLGDGWESNLANICHFRCLNLYSGVFDSALIVISYAPGAEDSVISTKKLFLDIIKCEEITFKVTKTTPYREAKTFNDEILSEMGKYDGVTFFAHNKGVTNVCKKDISTESILKYIIASYYLCLDNADGVASQLVSTFGLKFYGTFLLKTASSFQYVGTMYWLNEGRIKAHCEENSIDLPKCYDRELAERFPGSVCEWGNGVNAGSPGRKILYECDVYRNIDYPLGFLLTEEEKKRFGEIYSQVSNGLEFYKYTILTYNFGGYEIMREPIFKQQDVEYVYVTDDVSLTSNVWNIIVDDSMEGMTPIEKVYYVRNNLFKYCSTPICVRIDGSIEVEGSIDAMINEFNERGYDIGVMIHPERHNFSDEYDEWLRTGRVVPEEKDEVLGEMALRGYDLNTKGLYETGLFIARRNQWTTAFLKENAEKYNEFLNKFGKIRVDQIIYSYALNTSEVPLRIMPLSHACIQSSALVSCEHGTRDYTCIVRYIPERGYLRNYETTPYILQ